MFDRSDRLRLDDHLYSPIDTFTGILNRLRYIRQSECVGVDQGCVEALCRHQRHCPRDCALSLPANAIKINIVHDRVTEIDPDSSMGKSRKANLAAAAAHEDCLV